MEPIERCELHTRFFKLKMCPFNRGETGAQASGAKPKMLPQGELKFELAPPKQRTAGRDVGGGSKAGGGQLEEKSRRKSCVATAAIQCQLSWNNMRAKGRKTQTALWWNRTMMDRLTWFLKTTNEVRKNGGRSIEQDAEEEDEANKMRRKADECRKKKLMSDEDEGEASKLKE